MSRVSIIKLYYIISFFIFFTTLGKKLIENDNIHNKEKLHREDMMLAPPVQR